jgi:hypothetical protein
MTLAHSRSVGEAHPPSVSPGRAEQAGARQGCGWKPNPVPAKYDGRFCPGGPAPAPASRHEMKLDRHRLLTLGHILPASEGGAFEGPNLRAECTRCNYGQASKIQAAHARGLPVAGGPWTPPHLRDVA